MQKAIAALKELQKHTEARVFITGGFVRDLVLGKSSIDLDVVVRKLSVEQIVSYLKRLGRCEIVQLSVNGGDISPTKLILFKANGSGVTVQISLPRKGLSQTPDKDATLKQDAEFRDFTINALYLPIGFSSKRDVIDTSDFGRDLGDFGKRSIAAKAPVENIFDMSPIRLLRAISLAAQTGFRVTKGLETAIHQDRAKILRVAPELIKKELSKILLSKKPSTYIKFMLKVGLLKHVIPELAACAGVDQNSRYHKYDVFGHSVLTCDNTEPDIVMRWAGLLHDIGKPETRDVRDDGRVTFFKHEVPGARIARDLLTRLKYSKTVVEKVAELVRLHMYHFTDSYTDNGILRFIQKTGMTAEDVKDLSKFPLFKLRKAERLGNGFKSDIPVTQRQLEFQSRIEQVFAKGGGLGIKDLKIDGRVIMDAFELEPGKIIGETLEYLLERVRKRKDLNNRMTLMGLALNFLKSKRIT